MEPNKAKRSTILVAVALLATVVVALLISQAYKVLHTVHLSKSVRSDLPILDLRLQFLDIQGNEITPEHSILVDKSDEGKQTAPAPAREGCPELVGGDTTNGLQLSEKERQLAEDCPRIAAWKVKRHPIGFSLYFRDGAKVLSLFEENARVKELFGTKFFQGLFHDPLHDASIRAEDLRLEGIEGAFLARFLREALEAHGELHYDVAHGKKGFVFSFVRDECAFAAKALPVVARGLARSGYRIPKMEEPILEMRIGLQRLFLTQFKDRVYLANGLEALINVLESLLPPDNALPKAPVVLTVRAEAFVDKLLPVAVGEPTWATSLGFGLAPEPAGGIEFAAGKLTMQLHPKIFKGALASIPHDVFAAAVTSYYLPPEMTTESWRELALHGPDGKAAGGPDEAGFALLWDLSAEGEQVSQIGVVIAKQTTPDESEAFKKYFADPELTAECGGGTVFLAATSKPLLVRMKESCEGQSLSVLHWERGSRAKEYEAAQLFLFMNPGTGMRELFLAGGAKKGESESDPFEPKWKQEYETAKKAMREDGEKVFGSIPIFAYAGHAAPTAKVVQLKELTVKQGASR